MATGRGTGTGRWRRLVIALAAPLLLTGCLWGPGKFASDLTLKKDGAFVLNYRGEIVIQMPPDEDAPKPWSAGQARCTDDNNKERPCTKAEIASQKAEYDQLAAAKRKENEDMAK